MTRERVRAQQTAAPAKGARMLRGSVTGVSPLQVSILGGTPVLGVALPGTTYTLGAAVLVLVQEPAVGPVFPLT